MDENYKIKEKMWRGRKILERDIASMIKMEQRSKNYWFWFRIPKIPDTIWKDYQKLKKDSRNVKGTDEKETTKDRVYKERMDRLSKINELLNKGYTHPQIAVTLRLSLSALRDYLKEANALSITLKENNMIINHTKENRFREIPREFDKIEEK
jgi:uncharacterized protein YcgL (UPF0745 family)